MKTTFVSTYAMANGLRSTVTRIQQQMDKASKEISTSRHADVGLALGTRTGRTLSLRGELSSLDATIDSNGLFSSQLERKQLALKGMADGAGSFLSTLLSVDGQGGGPEILRDQARSALAAFIGLANTSGDGHYELGGINAGQPPIADYSGAPKTALDTAFAAAFGLSMPDPQSDPAVASIDPAAMADFLDNQFAALFDDPAWGNDWSSASSTNPTVRISPDEQVENSVNANEPALRKLAMAYTMISELGAESLSTETFNVIVDKAREVLGSATVELTSLRSTVGFVQERVSSATDRMTLQKDVVSQDINALEGVDPVEAKVRFDTLSTQIEMSYALTNRILNLSILNYA